MSASSINPGYTPHQPHLVTPPDRSFCASKNKRDAFDAPPGAAPFHRFLEANRLSRPNLDRFEPSTIHEAPNLGSSTSAEPQKSGLLPRVGEILTPTPKPELATKEVQLYQQHIPATGRVLDLYA
ncbi:MAG: hypothetical protein AB8C13_05835 [Phycisphaerales bacterium]